MKHYIIFLIILKLLSSIITEGRNLPLDITLSITCLVNGEINTIPNGCTAIAVSTHHMVLLPKLVSMKNDLVLMSIEETVVDQNAWRDIFNRIQNGDKHYFENEIFKDPLIDVIAFANMVDVHAVTYDNGFNTLFIKFMRTVRDSFPNKKVGLVVPGDKYNVFNTFNFELIMNVIDFVIIHSLIPDNCEDGAPPQSLQNIKHTVNDFVNGGIPRNKILQGINLLVGSEKDDDFMTMGLTELCHGKKSKKREFCMPKMKEYYDIGKYRQEVGLMGYVLEDILNDNYDGNCACAFQNSDMTINFPLVRLISDSGKTPFDDNYKCHSSQGRINIY